MSWNIEGIEKLAKTSKTSKKLGKILHVEIYPR